MTGIAVPVVLHLWNDRRGKVLPVGSVFLLQGASRRISFSRRLTRLWLLVLRCLMLLLLSLLLAGPVVRLAAAKPEKGWVLTAGVGDFAQGGVPGAASAAGAGIPAADLVRDGLAGDGAQSGTTAGLPADTRAAADLPAVADSLIKAGYKWQEMRDSNYWEAFAKADRDAPAGVPFYIFTTGELIHFAGIRPETERPVHWTILPDSGESHWVGRAWLASSDSIVVSSGVSLATSTVFRHGVRPAGGQRVYDTTLHVLIGADRREDARYVEAAVRAVGEYTRRKIDVAAAGPTGVYSADWLFWLSTRPLPAGHFLHVWKYEAGKEKKAATWMEGVEVSKEIEGAPAGGMDNGGMKDNGEMMGGGGMKDNGGAIDANMGGNRWTDGFGRGILSAVGGADTFRFYSRLDPAWNGLVWDPCFPILLKGVLFGQDSLSRQDRRALDPEQIIPTVKKANAVKVAVTHRDWDAGFICWILLLLVFILERIVSFLNNE